MATDDIQHLWRMRDTYRQTIQILEERQARFGGDLPTYMEIELNQARRDKEATEAKLQLLQPSDDLGSDARLALVEYKLNMLRDEFQTAWKQDDHKRQARQQSADSRMNTVMALQVLSIVVAVVAIITFLASR